MTEKRPIVVIGAVAAGTSAASQAKRRAPDKEVIMLEKGEHISYGACGIPYNIMDPKRELEDLVVISPEAFIKKRKIDTRLKNEAVKIDPEKHLIVVYDHQEKKEYQLEYDKLIISTGARPSLPPVEGYNLQGIFKLRDLNDGKAIKNWILKNQPKKAVIVGAGYIGMEMVEVFSHYGIEVLMMKRKPDVPTGFEPEIGDRVRQTLAKHNVQLLTGITLKGFEGKKKVKKVSTAQGEYPADMVLIATGVRPNSELAEQAGLKLGFKKTIAVNDQLQTSFPDIYSAGDCAEHWHRILKKPAWIPLGTTANKQGRIAGANAVGVNQSFAGIVGTAVFRTFELEVARTGLGLEQAVREGYDAEKITIHHPSRGHNFPGSKTITVVFIFDKASGKLLGAQMAGEEGVAKRIDVISACLHQGMSVEEVSQLDLSYAPPFAPVWDPILVCANQAKKML